MTSPVPPPTSASSRSFSSVTTSPAGSAAISALNSANSTWALIASMSLSLMLGSGLSKYYVAGTATDQCKFQVIQFGHHIACRLGCHFSIDFDKFHLGFDRFHVSLLDVGVRSIKILPVSYTHLTLPTNREV